jgi:hypothetical protein
MGFGSRLSKLTPVVFIGGFIAIGVTIVALTHADTFLQMAEPEDGAVAGCATKKTDPTAIGGAVVAFGTDDLPGCGQGQVASEAGATLPITYNLAALPGAARYVAPNGSDSAGNGSAASPYATLSKAYGVANANDAIVLRGGTYRQGNVTIAANKPVRIMAYPGEIPLFNGAQPAADSWTTEGSVAYRAYTPQPVTNGSGITFTTGQNLSGSGVGKYPDQAWAGDVQLRQVDAKSAVTGGTFWVDSASQRLYMAASDVAKGNVELSQKNVLLTVQAPGTSIEGLRVIRYSNSAADYGVIKFMNTADNSLLRNVEITDSAFMAVFYNGDSNTNTGSVMKNVTISTANWMGVSATYTDNLTLDAVRVTKMNQFNEFTYSPQSGALKTSRTRSTKVLNSVISDNNSQGLWFDQSNVAVTVANTRITDNAGSGLFFEISDDLLLVNSYIRAAGGARAVKLAGSSGLKLVNNTIIGGADPVGIYVDSRSMPGCADPAQALCAGSYGSDRDTVRSRPATLDWIPRLDLMINNVIAYPTAGGYCGTTTAMCITKTNAGASVPISTVIHQADPARGLPQTRLDGNVYINGTANIFNTEIGNYATVTALANAFAGTPVNIAGQETAGRYGTSWAGADGKPTPALAALHSQAVAMPSDAVMNQYIPAGTRHYGVLSW